MNEKSGNIKKESNFETFLCFKCYYIDGVYNLIKIGNLSEK